MSGARGYEECSKLGMLSRDGIVGGNIDAMDGMVDHNIVVSLTIHIGIDENNGAESPNHQLVSA